MDKPFRVSVVFWIYAENEEQARTLVNDMIETELQLPNFSIESVVDRESLLSEGEDE